MLERCINQLNYSVEEKKKCRFYLADSKGVPVWISDTLSVDAEGGEKNVQWILSNYIEYSNIKYPSKAKIYCVKQDDYSESVGKLFYIKFDAFIIIIIIILKIDVKTFSGGEL
jgi:hypothetical protein